MYPPDCDSVRSRWLVLTGLALGLLPLVVGRGDAADDATQRGRRLQMVRNQLEARGVKDVLVLAAMREVPRHEFVPPVLRDRAYDDAPLPIGDDQTISQPFIVALMTSAIHPRKGMRVLEIGTGSGYQAAVLARCVDQVDTIEIVPRLGNQASAVLKRLGYRNVHVRIGDGFDGWPERAPFDAVLLTAAPEKVPQPLIDQLRVGGRLVAPVGRDVQDLVVITRTERGVVTEVIDAVQFVPMTGKAARRPPSKSGAKSRAPK